jgi:hypothetical protein
MYLWVSYGFQNKNYLSKQHQSTGIGYEQGPLMVSCEHGSITGEFLSQTELLFAWQKGFCCMKFVAVTILFSIQWPSNDDDDVKFNFGTSIRAGFKCGGVPVLQTPVKKNMKGNIKKIST